MKPSAKIIKRRTVPNGAVIFDHPLLDRLYRSRKITQIQEVDHRLQHLLNPNLLFGMKEAVDLLMEVRKQQKKIIVVGDFDADGATSTALVVSSLRQLGYQKVSYLIPDRVEQGYGLSLDVAEMVLASNADCVITVDNGVSSLEGIAKLKAQGVCVVVTDHHLPPETLPKADVIINPNLLQCGFPSKCLAGVGVAFYFMLALRAGLRKAGIFNDKTQPNFTHLLDLVALGTVADVVPLDYNNRILAFQGLQRIQQGFCRPGIRALVDVANRQLEKLTTADLGFAIAPRINAAGRMDNMSHGVELLLCEKMETARELAFELDSLNRDRKEIEQGMKAEALKICRTLSFDNAHPFALALYQEDWHQGVLGIVAARIKETYHRPTIAFAKDQENTLKGSARSIEGVHIKDVIERIQQRYPHIIVKFGGHAMAAGLTIYEKYFDEFQNVFNQTVKEWVGEEHLEDVIWTDGELSPRDFSLETIQLIDNAAPWGQGFPEPRFDGVFRVMKQDLLKNAHLKFLLEPINGGGLLDGIAFNVDRTLYPDYNIRTLRVVYRLSLNEFRGKQSLQLMIEHFEPVEEKDDL